MQHYSNLLNVVGIMAILAVDASKFAQELAVARVVPQAFAEEFALSGWAEERILSLYTNPFYAGPHLAYRQLGEERVRRIIAEAVRPWSTNHA